MSSDSGELSLSAPSEVLLSCRRALAWSKIASGRRREAPSEVLGHCCSGETQRDFRAASRVSPGPLYLLCPGPGACLPGCCLRHGPISSGGAQGLCHASPLLPPHNPHPLSTAGFPDKGQGWGGRRGAALCLFPPNSPPPPSRAPSQQLSVPQRTSPSQKSPVWLRSGRRGEPCFFPLSLWHLSRPSLGSTKEVWGCL